MRGWRPMLRAAAFVVAIGAPAIGPLFSSDAPASVSIAVTWDSLLRESTAAAVVTPNEAMSVWENGRIYTYTHVRVERNVAGELPGDAWVRTMGGVVGKIGQLVEGEAVLGPGDTSLLFLRPGPVGSYAVTARGQGQFPVVADAATRTTRVVRSRAVGMLLPPNPVARVSTPTLAADILHGRTIDDAAKAITDAWERTHAP